MSQIEDRLDRLTPEQRALLGAMLRSRGNPSASPSRIQPRKSVDRRPLSFAQERFWFLDRLTPGSAVYTFGAHFRLDGPVDARALERSLVQVLRRHEVLRARIEEVDGEPVQTLGPVEGWALAEVHLEALPAPARGEEAARLVACESRRLFDLRRDPLLFATLIHLGPSAHLLLLTVHHLAADGWSMGVLAREVSDEYRALIRGEPSPVAPLAIQYADFAAWERDRLTGTALQAPLAYWRGRLAGVPPTLDLPHDHPRPAVPSLRSGHARLALEAPLHAAVVALGKAHGATLFMTLLAAFMVLLHRYSAEEDIAVGCPVAGRGDVETERLIGLFINTVVLRADLSGEPSFAETLRRVRGLVIDAFAHQDLPFARLVEELRPTRSAGVAPLFQVAFILQNAIAETLQLEGASVTALPFDNGTIDLDLAFELIERPDGLAGTLRYDAALFDAATVERMLAHYRAILAEATADPATAIGRLRLLSPGELATQLVEWNRTETAYPAHLRVDALVRAQIARTPDAVAVSHAGEPVTYGALGEAARSVAQRLIGLGAGPGARVAIYLDRSPAMVAALLGVLWAGCAYVPLDPEYPAERTAFVLADAEVAVVLTERRLAASLPGGEARILIVDEAPDPPISPGEPETAPASSAGIAYVIYTSGSTGRPKGVAVTHRNVVNFLTQMARSPGIGAADVLVAVTTLSFDIAGLELWLPLVTGARIELCDRATATDGAALCDLLERSGCTVMQATPATWRLLVEAGWRGGAAFKALCGGEALPPDLAQALLERAGSVYNLYGPTETTIWSTLQRLDGSGVTIGRPIANTRVYVLDRHREPVPLGVAGELYIGGAGVATGYRNRPELTRERFVPDPFAPATGHEGEEPAGARMYRTGDRVRQRADGAIEHLGRLDDQIKLRGFRIEPGEIEAVLCKHPQVRDAAVTAREHTPGDLRLCAYVVAEGPPVVAELRRALEAGLPAHMIPSAFVFLEQLPRTPNGKLDRRALPAPSQAPREAAAEAVSPTTPFERQLAAIWTEVLGTTRIGVTDDFFELGGHSLLAMRVLARVRDAFKLDPSLQSFFRAPTIRALAQHLEGLTAAVDELPLARRGAAAPALSFAQERFWFLERFEPGSAVYHIPAALRLRGPLDRGALQRALDAIVARHEVLRTALVSTADGGIPVVRPAGAVPLRVRSARSLPAREAMLQLEEHARVPFDFAAGMMLRGTVVELGDDDHAVLFLFHHIAADGWSLDVFFRELGPLYDAFAAGEPAPALPRLPLQYADFAVWQRRLAGGTLDAQLAYWKKQLHGAPTSLVLPLDAPRPAILSVRGATRSAELPRELLTSLHALGRHAGTTLFVTLLAALQALLFRLSGQDDVCVGTPVAGRTRLETEDLIGPFVNTLVIRGDLSGDPSFLELSARIREATFAAYAHQDVPFERLVEELSPVRSTSHGPLFQVLFVLQNAERAPLSLQGLAIAPLAIDTGIAKHDLTLWMREHPGGLHALLEYNTDLFQPAAVDRMLGHLERLLRGAVLRPAAPISTLPLLPGVEGATAPGPVPRLSSPARPEAPRLVPGNALEAELVTLWEQVLAVRPVGIQDDFFALGGHSLLAARLFDQIERRMGKKLPIAILFQAPTVERLAEILCRRGWSASWSSLVPIQTSGSRPPFFCVHAVGGNILNYQILSRHLGPEQPFYALQSRGLDGEQPPHDTVEEAAAHYLRELRSVQPRGPYHLGGTSSGGIVAFEMAQQLAAQGERVGLLALIDTQILGAVPLASDSPLQGRGRRLALLADWHVGQLLVRRARDWPAYLAERARAKSRLLLGRAPTDAPPTTALRHLYDRNRRALEAYVPRLYPGQVTMLLSQDEPFRAFTDLRLAWSRFAAGGLVVRIIPGDHEHTLEEPIVAHVAGELRALLGAARS